MKIDKVVVLGLGSAGANLLTHLMYDLPEAQFFGIDYDIVEPRNFLVGTQPYMKMHVGKTKVQAMTMLFSLAGKKFVGKEMKISSEQDLLAMLSNILEPTKHTLIVDAFDNPPSRNITQSFFRKIGYKNNSVLLHLGFSEKFNGELMWDDQWELMNESKSEFDICTQEGARSFIMALTSLASLAICDYNHKNLKRSLYFDKFFNIKRI